MAKILLVEDDFSLRDIYSARFQAEGYTVITASDGEEALATAMREHPDVIVLDVMMPKISGFDVLDILRSTPETVGTKVMIMTALSQESDRQRGETLGANKYLVKSQVTLEDVVSALKQVLGGGQTATPAATVINPQVVPPAPPAAIPTTPPVAAPPPAPTDPPQPPTPEGAS